MPSFKIAFNVTTQFNETQICLLLLLLFCLSLSKSKLFTFVILFYIFCYLFIYNKMSKHLNLSAFSEFLRILLTGF
jgi:hypothetical protein